MNIVIIKNKGFYKVIRKQCYLMKILGFKDKVELYKSTGKVFSQFNQETAFINEDGEIQSPVSYISRKLNDKLRKDTILETIN